MGYKGGEVTSDNIETLEALEEQLSYPPRFRMMFKANKNISDMRSQYVTVTFNGVIPPVTATIILKKSGILFLVLYIQFCHDANYQIHRYQ